MPSSRADAAIGRARALVGTRFLPQGRDPARGLDCVGLVAVALDIAPPPAAYALRCGSAAALMEGCRAVGLVIAVLQAPGTVLVLQAGAGQIHLGLWTGASLIHADAGLRRVVERPAPLPWPVRSVWSLSPEGEHEWQP